MRRWMMAAPLCWVALMAVAPAQQDEIRELRMRLDQLEAMNAELQAQNHQLMLQIDQGRAEQERLMQMLEVTRVEADSKAQAAQDAMRHLEELMTRVDPEAPEVGVELILQRAADRIDTLETDPQTIESLRRAVAEAYRRIGDLERADAMLNSQQADDAAVMHEDLVERARIAEERGRYAQALEFYEHAQQLHPDQFDSPEAWVRLGRLHSLVGNHEAAERILRRASEQVATEQQDGNRANVLERMARVRLEQGDLQAGVNDLRRALELHRGQRGANAPEVLETQQRLADMLARLGEMEEAEMLARDGLERARAQLGEAHPSTATAARGLSDVLAATGRIEEAVELSRSALETLAWEFGSDHPEAVRGHEQLGHLLQKLGRMDEAEAHIRHALEAQQHLRSDEETLKSHLELIQLYLEDGRVEDAKAESGDAGRVVLERIDTREGLQQLEDLRGLLRSHEERSKANELEQHIHRLELQIDQLRAELQDREEQRAQEALQRQMDADREAAERAKERARKGGGTSRRDEFSSV